MRNVRALMLAALACIPSAILADEPFDSSNWTVEVTGPGSGIRHIGNGVALVQRPYLLSKKEWQPSTLHFEWKPSPSKKGDDGRIYGDHLVVFLSTDGSFRKERSYESLTGIAVRLDSVTGNVSIQLAVDGVSFNNLATAKGTGPLDPEMAHVVTVKDDGTTVTVTLGEVTTSAQIPAEARKGKVWGFYNREAVGPVENVSIVRNIIVK